jgi:hypothetical protein
MKTLTRTISAAAMTATAALMMTSCTILTGIGGYLGTGVGIGSTVVVKRQFHVQLVECVGSVSEQSVTAVLAVTNTGFNDSAYIGGSGDRTVAIDSYGTTAKPYAFSGTFFELPSGVTVRVEVPKIGPVHPGATVLQSLKINIGAGKDNIAGFRNVPIVWQ